MRHKTWQRPAGPLATGIVSLLFCFVAVGSLRADWMYFSPIDNIGRSDLILVGVLVEPTLETIDGINYESATLKVEEALSGPSLSGVSVTLRWQNPTGRICPRVDNRIHSGKKRLWILTLGDDGDYRADNPWRVIDLEDLSEASAASDLLRDLRSLDPEHRSREHEQVMVYLERLIAEEP